MANLYDLKKFDLNLLVIFECIYQHLSISKAAAMLFITPSAVSQSLQRLRQQLNDPLFVRVGKGMTPTTACVNLHYHLQQNLEQLEKTINLNNRSELRKRIVIYGPPLFCSVNSHVMINQLCHQANLQIEHHNLTTTESAEELLAYRQAPGVHPHAHYQPRHDLSALSDGADAGGLPGGPSATRNAYLGRVTGAGVFHSLYYQRSRYSARAAKQHRLAESAQYCLSQRLFYDHS